MENRGKQFGEQVHVAGKELMDTIQRLIEEGKSKKIILWSEEGKKLLEIPLNPGVVIGGAAVILAPFFVALAGIAAVVKKVRIEIVPLDGDDKNGSEE